MEALLIIPTGIQMSPVVLMGTSITYRLTQMVLGQLRMVPTLFVPFASLLTHLHPIRECRRKCPLIRECRRKCPLLLLLVSFPIPRLQIIAYQMVIIAGLFGVLLRDVRFALTTAGHLLDTRRLAMDGACLHQVVMVSQGNLN